MKYAVKIGADTKPYEFKIIDDTDALPISFDEIWTESEWETYLSSNGGYTDVRAQNWLALEQMLYGSSVFAKAIASNGNGFSFLSKVFIDGKVLYASENALYAAIEMTRQTMQYPLSQEDIDYVNNCLSICNFSIRIS